MGDANDVGPPEILALFTTGAASRTATFVIAVALGLFERAEDQTVACPINNFEKCHSAEKFEMDSSQVDDAASMKRAATFKNCDVQRLIKAAQAAGLNPTAVEVDVKTGRIRVISVKVDDIGVDLDKWLEGHS